MYQAWATRARLEAAYAQQRCCKLCEHRCGVDRLAGERGPCKAGPVARVFKHRVEYGEEPELVPSHLFYLSGCDLRCAFCIAEANAFDPSRGVELTPEFLRHAVAVSGVRQGVGRWRGGVGGEPTIHLPAILAAMADCPDLAPIVWKSDFYGTCAAFALLERVVDVYVADFKFGNDTCARRIAGVERYLEVVTRNLRLAAGQGDLIVRHLLLPGHHACCFVPMVEWLAANLPGVKFSLRDSYLPRWRAHHFPELARPLERGAARPAMELVREMNLNRIA